MGKKRKKKFHKVLGKYSQTNISKKRSEKKTTTLTCAGSFPCEDAYHYHSANHHSAHWARIPVHNPLQRNRWTHWEAEYNSVAHYPAVVAAAVTTVVRRMRSWRVVVPVVVVAAAAAAQTA